MKTEIVEKIREITDVFLINNNFAATYEQPDMEYQLKTVARLLKEGIEIDVVKAPVILTTGGTSAMMVSRRLENEDLTVPDGCRIHIYTWFIVKGIEIIRLAFSDKNVEVHEECLV